MKSFRGQAGWAKNDVTWGQANSTGMSPDQKNKQSWGANLSLYKHCMWWCSLGGACLLSLYCIVIPNPSFTRTVVLPIFVTSDRFCQAVCPILPGSPTNFEIGIFLSLPPILCNVMSVIQILTKIGQTGWQNWSDSKNQTDFGCFV